MPSGGEGFELILYAGLSGAGSNRIFYDVSPVAVKATTNGHFIFPYYAESNHASISLHDGCPSGPDCAAGQVAGQFKNVSFKLAAQRND